MTRTIFGELQRHVGSAFSKGEGYEPTPRGARFSDTRVAGYFIDFRSKTSAPASDDPESLLPADLAQLALGWWERSLDGEAEASTRFHGLSALLAERAEVENGERRWSYPIPDRKYGIAPPFYSAMAQAQAASVFVRAYVDRGNPGDAELALGSVKPLVEQSELVALTPEGPVLEESPSDPPSHILNGWIYSLMGLWDVQLALGDSAASTRYDESLQCLIRLLERYDVGWWTRYSLYPHRLPDLAKPFYHRLHIDQVDALYRLTGYSALREAAARWRRYDTRANTARAVGQKAVFVASRYR